MSSMFPGTLATTGAYSIPSSPFPMPAATTLGAYGGTYAGAGYSGFGGVGQTALFRERTMAIPMTAPMATPSPQPAMMSAPTTVAPMYMPSSYVPQAAAPPMTGYPIPAVTPHTGQTKITKDTFEFHADINKARVAEVKAEKSRAEAMVAAAVYKEKMLAADMAMLDVAKVRYDIEEKGGKKLADALKGDD